MIAAGYYPNEEFTILAGTKNDGAIAYVWYYSWRGTARRPALTDSYREFWF